jgi:hypothetical protein
VMCGMPGHDGGVRLIASKELNTAELRAEFSRAALTYEPLFLDPSSVSQRYFLTAEMRTFTVIDAPDYPTAFKALFEGWTPEPAARPAIGDGQREITPGMMDEKARRMALYGPCEGCGAARDARPAQRDSGLTYEFYCPGCGRTG